MMNQEARELLGKIIVYENKDYFFVENIWFFQHYPPKLILMTLGSTPKYERSISYAAVIETPQIWKIL